MNKLKLTAVLSLFLLFLSSCDKDDETRFTQDTSRYISNYDFFLNGAQQVPANASTGSGRIEGTYDRKTRIYTYRLAWQGLSSNVTAIHIHGVADRGYVAIPVAPLAAYTNGIVQTAFGNPTTTSGTYSGSLYVDGLVVKEQDLLANKFYVDIHTTGSPNGEIRGQIIFP